MNNLFNKFREKVLSSFPENKVDQEGVANNLIALGVLLWVVAEADDKFLPQEEEKIKDVLNGYGDINVQDMPIVLRAIKEAAIERIDLYGFTKEVSEGLERSEKIEIVENLFRVGCNDGDLDLKEHEAIRKISDLFRLDHSEFIDAKVKVKKEFGMDTSGL